VNIREASRAVGRSPDTLRRWEEEGLISPRRDARGHRVYSDRDLAACRELAGHAFEAMSSSRKLSQVIPIQLSFFDGLEGG
jgi:hypothetical protein